MEKRLPLALFLAFLILFGWTLLFPAVDTETGVGDPGGGGGSDPTVPEPAEPAEPVFVADVSEADERSLELVVGRPTPEGEEVLGGYYRLAFSNRGACLTELDFGDYFTVIGLDQAERSEHRFWLPLVRSIETDSGPSGSLVLQTGPSSAAYAPLGLDRVLWEMEALTGSQQGVRFRYGRSDGVVFTKRIVAVPDTWNLRCELEIENLGTSPGAPCDFVLTPAGVVPPELADRFYPEPRAAAAGFDRGDDEYVFEWEDAPSAAGDPGEALEVPTPLEFIGVHNKYFAFLLRGADDLSRSTLAGASYQPVVRVGDVDEKERDFRYIRADATLSLRIPAPGERTRYDYLIYAGPKSRDVLVDDFPPHASLLDDDLGFFDTIGRVLLAILGFFHGLTGNWGVSIILLTVCVRLVLFPLNRRSQTAMARYQKKMKRVQPKLTEVKERYANDPQKQREAQARIMQEEGAFPPLGGCLPIFLQIPIFFGLFSALRTSFDLRQAPFYGWINDLSRSDRLLQLDIEIPLLITSFDMTYLNLLPILMVVLWIWQQRGMPQPTDEQAKRMQKMMLFMPVLFGFFLYNYAAGLSLYMMTQSTLGIVEQKIIKKIWPVDDTEQAKKDKPSGCGPFSGVMQNIAEKQREQAKQMQSQRDARVSQSKKQKRRKQRK